MNNNFKLICPLCHSELKMNEKQLVCENNHSFDIARQGYANLLPVQKKHSLNPGDAKEMLTARRDFLNTEKYFPICQSVIDAINKYSKTKSPLLVDVGCGEGYYTAAFEKNCNAKCIGADIAKDGVKMACSRSKDAVWLVATASLLPVADCSVDVVTAMFSLLLQDEYARILKKGGCVVEVTVGSKHLIELKQIIYDEVFEQHKHPSECGSEFKEVSCEEHSFKIMLNNEELKNLLLMTPHFWRIHKQRKEMLNNIPQLEVTVDYFVRVLQKAV